MNYRYLLKVSMVSLLFLVFLYFTATPQRAISYIYTYSTKIKNEIHIVRIIELDTNDVFSRIYYQYSIGNYSEIQDNVVLDGVALCVAKNAEILYDGSEIPENMFSALQYYDTNLNDSCEQSILLSTSRGGRVKIVAPDSCLVDKYHESGIIVNKWFYRDSTQIEPKK